MYVNIVYIMSWQLKTSFMVLFTSLSLPGPHPLLAPNVKLVIWNNSCSWSTKEIQNIRLVFKEHKLVLFQWAIADFSPLYGSGIVNFFLLDLHEILFWIAALNEISCCQNNNLRHQPSKSILYKTVQALAKKIRSYLWNYQYEFGVMLKRRTEYLCRKNSWERHG